MLVFVCKGKASEIMKVQPKLETNPAEYFTDLVALSRRTGMFPMVTVNDFLKKYEAYSQENYLPLLAKFQVEEGETESNQAGGEEKSKSGEGGAPKEEGPKEPAGIRLIGSAIFKKDHMVGVFDIYETQILLLLNDEFKEAMLSIEDPLKKDNYIVFNLMSTAPVQIRYRPQNNLNFFKVMIKLEANIVSIQSRIDYTRPQLENYLGRVIAEELKKRVDKTIKKAQLEFNSDVFGFGDKVKRTFLTSTAYENYHWPDKFKDSMIETEVKVDIRRVGVQFQPPVNR